MSADPSLTSLAQDLLISADQHSWSYQWTWLGLPIIQLPTDLVAVQEVVWSQQPDLIIETGIARGGSLVLLASLLELLGCGEVVGIDVEIRPHNREAVEAHPLAPRISLIEGSSTSDEVMALVCSAAASASRVMVVLDSNHTHEHVLRELELYAPLVTPGQYLVVCDTVVEDLPLQTHRPRPWGPGDNPATALREFLASSDEFEVDRRLAEKLLLTSSPGGYVRRISEVSTS
ncbi:MAG: CmcI family methyltransferase [Acidimicrobiales bacterium]